MWKRFYVETNVAHNKLSIMNYIIIHAWYIPRREINTYVRLHAFLIVGELLSPRPGGPRLCALGTCA
jgi:hypothetical protein